MGVMKETKRSLVSRSSALFHFSISLSPSSYFFFLSAYSDNLNSDLAGTEKCREPWLLEKGQCHGLVQGRSNPPVVTTCRARRNEAQHPTKSSFRARDERYQLGLSLTQPGCPKDASSPLAGRGGMAYRRTRGEPVAPLALSLSQLPHLSNPVDNNPHLGG